MILENKIRTVNGNPKQTAELLLSEFDVQETSVSDVHRLANELGIYIKYALFDTVQGGLYIIPEDEDDLHFVVLNANDNITRQRFTLAHEIGHYLRYQYNGITVNSETNRKQEDKFCDDFASNLLMPNSLVESYINQRYDKHQCIDFEEVHSISRKFGVSFEMAVFTLAYRFGRIDGDIASKELRKRIKTYQENQNDDLEEYLLSQLSLYRLVFNQIRFDLFDYDSHRLRQRLNQYIHNELRNEGVNLEINIISEIVVSFKLEKDIQVDLKIAKKNEVLQASGQYKLYEDIINQELIIESLHEIKSMHKTIYSFAPYNEYAGKFREGNPIVTKASFEIIDSLELKKEFYKMNKDFETDLSNIKDESHSKYIEFAIDVHYQIVKLHPFIDGNGRTARAFMNKLLFIRSIPLIFFINEDREKYINNLRKIDVYNNYTPLYLQVYKSLLFALAD